jgi:hypothetical protein
MALVLVLCMATGIVLYWRLDEFRVDVFGIPTVVQSVPTVPPAGTPRTTRTPAADGTSVAAAKEEPTPDLLPTSTPPPAAVKYRVTRTQGENLNMRQTASTQSPIVARLPPNTVVEDAGELATGPAGTQQVPWRKVKGPGGQVGWVPEQYLEKAEA